MERAAGEHAAGGRVAMAGCIDEPVTRRGIALLPPPEECATDRVTLRRVAEKLRPEGDSWVPPREGGKPVPDYCRRVLVPLTHVDAGAWLR